MIILSKHLSWEVFLLYNRGMILGIDEAGRGPWAGPLVVGAVVLGGAEIEGLTDSKKLSKKKREALYDEVTSRAVAYASGWVTAAELDEIGMSEALRLATRRAVEQVAAPYSEIIIDGTINFLTGTGKGKYVQTMAKADLLVPSVSAASIIAKVERDRYMTQLGEQYPEYGFGLHAGYGVAKHHEAIERYGVMSEHRLSFAPLQKYATLQPEQLAQRQAQKRRTHATPTPLDSAKLAEAQTFSNRKGADVTFDGLSRSATSQSVQITTKTIGDRAENVVAEYLQRKGHEILERNWRTKFCEIDIVSRAGDTIYFTEVKYRKNANQGGGMAAITSKKLRQMKFAAEYYALKHQPHDTNLMLAAAEVAGEDFAVTSWLELR